VIDLKVRWRKGQHIEPDWPLEHGYLVQVEGQPCVRTKLEIRPPKGFVGKSFEDFMQLGMIITALPAVNAIPAVCAAPPGHPHLRRPAADHGPRLRPQRRERARSEP
jgi:hypothetical protein